MTTGRLPSVEGGIQPTIVDAKGDIIAATAADTVSRLAVGANDTVLTADSSTATGLKWATVAAGGGKILQVVSATTSTEVSNSTTTYTDTGITATITPTSATSTIFVQIMVPYAKSDNNSGNRFQFRLDRSGTILKTWTEAGLRTNTAINMEAMLTVLYIDSPATTSSRTYKMQFRNEISSAAVKVCNGGTDGLASITLLEIGA